MTELLKVYQEAIRHFGVARYSQAEDLCRQILSKHANHAEALHLIGLTAYKRGDLSEALVRIEKALRYKPSWEMALNSLGMVLFGLGRTEEAIDALQRAIRSKPNWSEPYNNLGVALNHAHRYDEALKPLTRALELQPENAEVCTNIGIALFGMGQNQEAIECYTRAVELQPEFRSAWFHRGRARAALEEYAKALADYQQVLNLTPDWPDAYNGIGMIRAKRLEFEQALAAYEKAIELDESFFQAHYNRANVLVLIGRYDEAVVAFTKAIELHPEFADAYWNRGLAFLLKGDYVHGWVDYAWRKQTEMNLPTYPHKLTGPQWSGESFEGKRMLVHYEQGYGDSIQCWRFLPQVKAYGGTVVVEERGFLLPLLSQLGCADETIASSQHRPPQTTYDLHVSMLDLPRIFRADPDNVGGAVPYLRASEDRIEKWAGRIDPESFSVGIAWAGSPLHKNDRNRSCRLNDFFSLGQIEGVRLYSLQKGPVAAELASEVSASKIVNLGSDFEDFGDTAGALAHLDLVISVDTAVLHLAGAMGKQAWGLLAFAPDWRWMRDCEVSPWYPTVRLFRQRSWGDWDEVFLRVIGEVKKISHRSGL